MGQDAVAGFPGRRTADQIGLAHLSFRSLASKEKSFSPSGTDIATIDLWEIRLERETKERIAKGDFTGAYPFLSVLIRDFPNRPGLRQLRSEFLWNDAIARAKRGELAPTLAMLEELHRYAPEYKRETVTRAIGGVTDRLMQKLVDEDELDLAQQLLARLEKDYQTDGLPSVQKWNQEFLKMATAKREQAIAARDAKDYRSARRLARESVYLKPEISGGQELIREIDTIYPLVNVGVLQSATVLEPTRMDNWGARRAGRLIYRTLFEMQGAGPEGGEYDFIFGDVEMSADRMHFDLLLEPENLEPPLDRIQSHFLADVLAMRAQLDSPSYFAPWAAAVESIGLKGPQQVTFNLRRPHVLPICLLQIPVDGSWFGGEPGSPTGDYRRDVVEEIVVRYVLSGEPKTPTQPREIVEIRSASASDGGEPAVCRDEVDVLDQLFPADAIRLSKSKSIKVAITHCRPCTCWFPVRIIPTSAATDLPPRLVYGINREDILKGELLEGLESEGCRVLSGPFPAGLELNDPLGYAYDQSIEPRPYEPPLAKLLAGDE